MIERQKKSKPSVTTVSVSNNKKKVDTKVDNNTGTEINNNINIKLQTPVEPKKKKRKYKKRIPKKVKDDFLNTLNEYTALGGTDTGTSITDIKKLKEAEIIDLTNSLKVKILALKSAKEQEQLALQSPVQKLALPQPQTRMALPAPTTDYSQIPARASQGFQRTSLPAIMEAPKSSLVPKEYPPVDLDDPDVPLKRLLPRQTTENPLFEPQEKFLSGLTDSEMIEVNSDKYEPDNFTRLKEIYKKYFGYEYPNYSNIDKDDQMDNIRTMLRIKDTELKRTKTSDPKIEDLPEETQSQIGLLDFAYCNTNRRTGSFSPCLKEYENYLQYLVDNNDRKELEFQYQQALKRQAQPTFTNIQLLNQIEGLTDYVPILANDNFYKYTAMKKIVQPETPVVQPETPVVPTETPVVPTETPVVPTETPVVKPIVKPEVQTEVLPTEITPEDLKLINIAEDEENLETLQSIYKKYFGKNYEYKRENIGERVFDIIAELKKLKSTTPELTYKTITEYTPETCKNKTGRNLLGVFNPCLSEYENYLKNLIDKNDRIELEIQFENALYRKAPSTSNNVLLVNQIIEQSDYVPQLANDNFYKYEALKKLKSDEIVPEVVKNTPSKEDIEIMKKLEILEPFYTRFYPAGVFKPLNSIKPSVYELVYMIRLIDNDFVKGDSSRDMLQTIFNEKYVKYKEQINKFVNTEQQEGRSANLKQAVEQRISQDNEVTVALLVTLASYDAERPAFIYQYDYIPELSDEELAVYAESDGRNIVVGNRGSTTLTDWVETDIQLAFGKLADSSERWNRTLQKIKAIANYDFNNNNDSFIFTGDSLGGSLAYEQAVYVYQNRPQFNDFDSYAITFNAGQGLPSSSQFFAFLKENLFKDEWYQTHLLNFTVTGDIISNLGRAIGAGTQISVPWSVSGQPHNLENFVKFNVDSYKDFVNTEQAPRVKSQKTTGNQQISQEEGYDYKTLGLVVGAGVLAGALAGAVTKNPQLAARAGYYSTRALGPSIARGISVSSRNIARGAIAGGTIGSVEEGIRQNLIAGSNPQFFGTLAPQYKETKTPTVPRIGTIPESQQIFNRTPISGRSLNNP